MANALRSLLVASAVPVASTLSVAMMAAADLGLLALWPIVFIPLAALYAWCLWVSGWWMLTASKMGPSRGASGIRACVRVTCAVQTVGVLVGAALLLYQGIPQSSHETRWWWVGGVTVLATTACMVSGIVWMRLVAGHSGGRAIRHFANVLLIGVPGSNRQHRDVRFCAHRPVGERAGCRRAVDRDRIVHRLAVIPLCNAAHGPDLVGRASSLLMSKT